MPKPKIITPDDKRLGANLAALRKAKGLTQFQLAVESGVSFSGIQKLEAGTNQVGKADLDTILNLARVLGTTADELRYPTTKTEGE